MTIMLNFKLGF